MTELIGMAIHSINIILLIVLLYIYVQNYRQLKTKLNVGLILFVLLFLIQSFMNVYYDTAMIMYSSTPAETAATMLEGIKAVAFAILAWISWE